MRIKEMEYISKQTLVATNANTQLIDFEPWYVIFDNGAEYATKCSCEDCILVRLAIFFDRIENERH